MASTAATAASTTATAEAAAMAAAGGTLMVDDFLQGVGGDSSGGADADNLGHGLHGGFLLIAHAADHEHVSEKNGTDQSQEDVAQDLHGLIDRPALHDLQHLGKGLLCAFGVLPPAGVLIYVVGNGVRLRG